MTQGRLRLYCLTPSIILKLLVVYTRVALQSLLHLLFKYLKLIENSANANEVKHCNLLYDRFETPNDLLASRNQVKVSVVQYKFYKHIVYKKVGKWVCMHKDMNAFSQAGVNSFHKKLVKQYKKLVKTLKFIFEMCM